MHALEVIVRRNAEAAGREAAIAELDGKDDLAVSLIQSRPDAETETDENRAFWRANSATLHAEGKR